MAVPIVSPTGTLTRIGLYSSENISQYDSYRGFICYDTNGDEVTYSDPPGTGGSDDEYPFHWYTTGTQVDVVKIEYNDITYLCNCPGNGSSYKLYLDQLEIEGGDMSEVISPAIYFGEILVGKVNEEPTPTVTNYVKISNVIWSGTVIELGSEYDTSDLSNNPPIVYGPDGSEVEGVWMSNVNFAISDSEYHYEFNSATNPTSYRRSSGGGG